ncbi:MAG TPA: hypothetical protein VFT53_02925 [Candidatus Saccharimonadales bacterium]|nr:hypothetical protein [Candidatus Saccharimonadales bacterium]
MDDDFFNDIPRSALRALIQVSHRLVFDKHGWSASRATGHGLAAILHRIAAVLYFFGFTIVKDVAACLAGAAGFFDLAWHTFTLSPSHASYTQS